MILWSFGLMLSLGNHHPYFEKETGTTVEPSEETTVEPSKGNTVEPSEETTVEPSKENTVEPSAETTVPEPTPPGEVANANMDKVPPEEAGAEPCPATPTPTVAESTVPGSSPGSPSPQRASKRGKSPTYFRFLGGDFEKHAVPNHNCIVPKQEQHDSGY